MTTVVSTSTTEVTTPTSYVSHWIAQSHGKYQKKANEYYSSSSSCDCRPSILKTSIKTNSNSHTTTWQAQAKSRLNTSTTTVSSDTLINNNNSELQEKLNRIR